MHLLLVLEHAVWHTAGGADSVLSSPYSGVSEQSLWQRTGEFAVVAVRPALQLGPVLVVLGRFRLESFCREPPFVGAPLALK